MHTFLQASFFAFCFIELSFGSSLQKNNASKPNLDQLILPQHANEKTTIDLQNWGLVNTNQLKSGRPKSDLQNWGLVNTDQSNSSRTESNLQNWGLVNTGQSSSGRPESDLQIWGLLNTGQSNSGQLDLDTNPNTVQASTNAPVATQDPSPCQPYVVQRPDFRKPGRRITEAKCFEYIWEMKNREDVEMHEARCSQDTSRVIRSLTRKATFKGGRTLCVSTPAAPPPHLFLPYNSRVKFCYVQGALGWSAIDGESLIFKCGCTLVSSKFVVTAAHCSRASPNDVTIANVIPEVVKLGDESTNNHVYIGIAQIIVHPLYKSPMKFFDIALVELAMILRGFSKYLQPACLWHEYDTSSLGSQAIVTGWGYTDLVKKTTSKELQAAVLNIIDQNQCAQLLGTSRFFDGLKSHQLCAGKLAGGVDTCQGDSGGPLQVKITVPSEKQGKIYYLIGVTSFGRGCGNPDSPGVYTRISSFVDWIESIVWAE